MVVLSVALAVAPAAVMPAVPMLNLGSGWVAVAVKFGWRVALLAVKFGWRVSGWRGKFGWRVASLAALRCRCWVAAGSGERADAANVKFKIPACAWNWTTNERSKYMSDANLLINFRSVQRGSDQGKEHITWTSCTYAYT